MVPWGDWKLIIGSNEYKTPYKSEDDWKKAMEENSKRDTARMAVDRFRGGVFNKIDSIIGKATLSDVAEGNSLGETVARRAMEMAIEDQQKILNKAKEENEPAK